MAIQEQEPPPNDAVRLFELRRADDNRDGQRIPVNPRSLDPIVVIFVNIWFHGRTCRPASRVFGKARKF